ncbi:MAG TPA: serine/threonine-protein kinase [Burkholderiaceae bacterium]|nr:serine/threonine-protein kinase [Burkholderiaceae bacterium]
MALTAAELGTISRLLDEALGLGVAARQRWLDTLPREHRKLAPVLREMLARAETTTGSLLDRPPRLREEQAAPKHASALQADALVGPYQLIRELGIGGMAEVWLARRADGAYKRDVALKVTKAMRTRKELERLFARERDIQASLEHPNIARLYDAGVSAEGLPYLAMEYVQGQPVTGWCDAHRVGLRERLTLFLQVTDAVQYAHARQVVHRDLKPSNILVTETGQVRLLDFGIAKLVESEEAEHTLVNLYARALTPEYASPELLRGEPVEAASDVYSLGVVLYELLTGNRPYRLESASAAATFAQAIADVRLEKPSGRLAPGAGMARATTQDRLAGRLNGDLDAVALKALAWSPADRYPSVAALADDLRRYLRGESVHALPNKRSAEELVAALARNPNVRVRRRSLEPRPVGPGQDVHLDATPHEVRATSEALRITVQITDATGGTHFWTQTYDLEVNHRARARDDARSVAEAVEAALAPFVSRLRRKSAKS